MAVQMLNRKKKAKEERVHRRRAEAPKDEKVDTVDWLVRSMPRRSRDRLSAEARVRNLTVSQMLETCILYYLKKNSELG